MTLFDKLYYIDFGTNVLNYFLEGWGWVGDKYYI